VRQGQSVGRARRYREYREPYYPRSVSVWVGEDDFYLTWADRCGRVFAAVLLPFLSGSAGDQQAEIWARIHGGPMKRKERQKLVGGLVHARDERFAKAYPRLHEWLTAARFEEGDEVREAPTVTLWASQGQWRGGLKDREEHLVLWLVGDTVQELLKLAESFCQDEAGPWRHDDSSSPLNGKRVKKS